MASIQSQAFQKQLREDPEFLLQSILANNLQQVSRRLKFTYNITANTAADVIENIDMLVQAYPSEAAEMLMDILSVDIDGDRLSPVGADAILNEVITADGAGRSFAKSGSYDPTIDELNQEIMGNGVTSSGQSTANQTASNFNWGQFVGASLPGLLGLFGVQVQNGPGQNSQTAAILQAQQQAERERRQRNWFIGIGVAVVLLILVFVIWRTQQN